MSSEKNLVSALKKIGPRFREYEKDNWKNTVRKVIVISVVLNFQMVMIP